MGGFILARRDSSPVRYPYSLVNVVATSIFRDSKIQNGTYMVAIDPGNQSPLTSHMTDGLINVPKNSPRSAENKNGQISSNKTTIQNRAIDIRFICGKVIADYRLR